VTRRILIVAALALVLCLVGWYEGLYRPETSQIKNLNAQEQAAQASLVALGARYDDLVRSEKRLPEERAALAKLKAAVPNGPELDNLVTTLFAAATSVGVQVANIASPQPATFGSTAAVASTGPAQVSLSISVTGTPQQIEHLVAVLDATPRLLVVDNFNLAYPAAASSVSTSSAKLQAGSTLSGNVTQTTLSLRAFYASASSDSAAS
jgi:Tfp pilus assembly protein PilO